MLLNECVWGSWCPGRRAAGEAATPKSGSSIESRRLPLRGSQHGEHRNPFLRRGWQPAGAAGGCGAPEVTATAGPHQW